MQYYTLSTKGQKATLTKPISGFALFSNTKKGAQIIKIPSKGYYDVQPQRCR